MDDVFQQNFGSDEKNGRRRNLRISAVEADKHERTLLEEQTRVASLTVPVFESY